MIILSIIAFIIVIGIIILVHEAGHFFTARKAGVKCTEFSIGMGPVIKQWKSKETTVSLRWIPLGGYVQMVDGSEPDLFIDLNKELGLNLKDGAVKEIVCSPKVKSEVSGIVRRVELKSVHGEPLEIDLEVDGEIKTYPVLKNAFYVLDQTEKVELTPYNKSIDSKKIWQRFAIFFAGAFMNFVLGLLLCLIASFIQGVPNYDSAVIGSIESDYPASSSGLEEGDQITSIVYGDSEYDISSWTDISEAVDEIYDDNYVSVDINYLRDGVSYTAEDVSPYVYIYNVGITNIDASEYTNESGVDGVVVGTVAIDYDSDGGNELSEGDVITQLRVDEWDGDEYVESDFKSVSSWTDIISSLDVDTAQVYFKYLARTDDDGEVSYSEEETTNSITLYSEEVLEAQDVEKISYYFGISPEYHFDFSGCVSEALDECGSYFSLVVKTLKVMVFPSDGARTIGLSNLSSVVGIYDMVSSYLTAGISTFLFFVAMLSINIGIMNLLPIPALDGGRILFIIYEGITGRKPNKKIETFLTLIVYVLLFALFIYVTINDIQNLIG